MRGLCAWHAMKPFGLVAATALLVALLAGCTTPPPPDESPETPPAVRVLAEQYAGFEIQPLDFVASDGTYIHASLYLPRDPRPGFEQAERFGTIVNFSPYYLNAYGIDTDGRLSTVTAGRYKLNETGTGILVAHGFAYVAASVPGTGQSGGCFELGGRHEQTVMAEFIDWAGEQPWSNGNVGMVGGSYDGTTQWMAAIHQPKHLKTIVPWISITDMYNYEYQDGAPFSWHGPYFVPHYLMLVGFGYDPVFSDPTSPPQGVPPGIQPDLLLEDLCPGVQDQIVSSTNAYATGVYDTFWQERNYAREIPRINASVFMVHGLWDWNVKPLHTAGIWDQIRSEKAMWLQQMHHNAPWRDTYNADFNRPDYNATLLAWYDHYLNGADNGVPESLPPVQTQDHTGFWRQETAWPPTQTIATRFYVGEAALSDQPGTTATTIVTPPSYVGAYIEGNQGVGGPDAPDQVVAKFATAKLDQPMRIAGVVRLTLNITVDRPGYSHVVAQLYNHHADGSWEFLGMGGRGLAQRGDRTQDDAVEPFVEMTVPVDLQPTDSYVEAGDQLVILVSGDDTAWFHPNGNTPTIVIAPTSNIVLPLLPDGTPRGLDSKAMAAQNPYYQKDRKEY